MSHWGDLGSGVVLSKGDAKKTLIIQSYNQTASHYDRRYRGIQFRKLCHLFTQHPLINDLILDFGCGTGIVWDFLLATNAGKDIPKCTPEKITIWIDNWLHDTSKKKKQRKLIPNCLFPYIGIDLSFGMLQIFRQKTLHEPLSHIHLICADGENLPFRASQFRIIISLTTLQNLPEPRRGITEIIRVKSKEAVVLLSYLKKSITKSDFMALMQDLFSDFQEIIPIEAEFPVELEDWLGKAN